MAPPPNESSEDETEDDYGYGLSILIFIYICRPQAQMEHPSSSVVALNPHIRRQKRRHDDSGGNR